MTKSVDLNSVRALVVATSLLVFSSASNAFQFDTVSTQLRESLQAQSQLTFKGVELRHPDMLASIYQNRDYLPIWVDNGQFTSTATAIIKKLNESYKEGLNPEKYYTEAIQQWVSSANNKRLNDAEILLTDSLLQFFHDVAMGSIKAPGPKQGWHIPASVVDVAALSKPFFTGEATFKQVLNTLRPENTRYHSLLSAHAHYSAIQARGEWPAISGKQTLREGDINERVVALKQRLMASGDLIFDTEPMNLFDASTARAVMNFQSRHGLDADAVVGAETIRALNVPVTQKLAQIELNLERWRWLPRDLGERHILVNVAGSELEVKSGNDTAMEMRVVVGKTKHKTPLFSDEMEYLVFNPPWHVPSSITRKLLAKERNSPGYLDSKKFEAIPLAKYAKLPISALHPNELEANQFLSSYRLRQAPGKKNTLGNLKFMFPNKFSVYLHDTQQKNLFTHSRRAYSHGCVRLEEPEQLARLLLQQDGVSDAEIDNLIDSNKTRRKVLQTKVPVHLTYQTVWVDQLGTIQFRRDLYRHDKAPIKKFEESRIHHAAIGQSLLDETLIQLAAYEN